MIKINYKGILAVCGIGVLCIVMLVMLVSVSGCVTVVKNTYAGLTATPVPTPTPIPPTPVSTPTPVPTPTKSTAQIFTESGGLHQGQWLDYTRDNVSGRLGTSVHVSVYGWRMYDTITWQSISWGQYFRLGAGARKKWLFVLVNSYADDNTASVVGVLPDQFRVQIGSTLYELSDELLPEIRIRELDDVWDLSHTENVKPYGYLRRIDQKGEHADTLVYLTPGRANGWDGYIVFQIPGDANLGDISILATFQALAAPHWWSLE